MTQYLPVVVYLVVIVAFAVVSLGLARLLSPSRPTVTKLETYECGSETFGDAEGDAKSGEVIDLMEALRASVARTKAARSEPAEKTSTTKKAPSKKKAG